MYVKLRPDLYIPFSDVLFNHRYFNLIFAVLCALCIYWLYYAAIVYNMYL
jgi:hypothetical protein